MSNNIEALNTQNKLAVDGALEKLESGNANFISNDEAKVVMAKRKGEVREKEMTKSIEALIARKGNAVTGNYYLAKCENCEEMFSSGKMTGGEPLYSGDYGDSYCPHCGVDDSEISDCGNEALEAWNFQQKHIDVLIAALEQSQQSLNASNELIDKIHANSCQVGTGDNDFIPNSLDAWGRPVKQYLPYDFSGNPSASATQYCNGWNDAGGYWLNYVGDLKGCIAELEALCVKPTDAMREVAPLCVKLQPRRTADDFVDEEFSNEDLAMVYNSCRLECEVRIKNAGGAVEGSD